MMGDVSRLLADYGPAFGQALFLTWKLTVVSFVPGFLLGVIVTVLRLFPLPPLRFVLIVYEPSVILTLVLVCSAFTADYLRSGINTIAGGQIEAALSLGLRPMQIISVVVLPQALRAVVQPM